MTTTLLDVLSKTTAWFEARGLESPRLDAQILIAHALGIRRLDLYLQHDRPLAEPELVRLRDVVRERSRGVPVAYLTGEKEFFSLKFTVTRDVLVPRPETEGLVEAALAFLKDVEQPTFADVGTGSGCVAIAVLYRVPAARGFASDTSAAALGVAKANAARLGVADRFDAREGCLLAPLRNEPAFGRLDAVLSNPPYVVRGDPSLARGVADHEPAAALYVDGDDSLVLARALASEALAALRTGGLLAIEIGHRDGAAAKSMLEESGYRDVAVDSDLGGIPRVVKGRRP